MEDDELGDCTKPLWIARKDLCAFYLVSRTQFDDRYRKRLGDSEYSPPGGKAIYFPLSKAILDGPDIRRTTWDKDRKRIVTPEVQELRWEILRGAYVTQRDLLRLNPLLTKQSLKASPPFTVLRSDESTLRYGRSEYLYHRQQLVEAYREWWYSQTSASGPAPDLVFPPPIPLARIRPDGSMEAVEQKPFTVI